MFPGHYTCQSMFVNNGSRTAKGFPHLGASGNRWNLLKLPYWSAWFICRNKTDQERGGHAASNRSWVNEGSQEDEAKPLQQWRKNAGCSVSRGFSLLKKVRKFRQCHNASGNAQHVCTSSGITCAIDATGTSTSAWWVRGTHRILLKSSGGHQEEEETEGA